MSKKRVNKKVLAGKKRASLSLRDSKGRFTTNLFKREVIKTVLAKKGIDVSQDEKQKDRSNINEIIKASGITQTELNKEYKQNIDFFSNLIENGAITTTFKNANQIEKDVNNFKGSFIITRKGENIKVTKNEMKLELAKFKQFISSTVNASDYSQKIKITFDGKMIINIPDIKKMRRNIKDDFDDGFEDDSETMQQVIDYMTDEFDDNDDIIIYGS